MSYIRNDWQLKNFNRISAINLLISKSKKKRPMYLEIGCALNTTFDSIPVLDKIGVDPNRGGTHRMTSDSFFALNSSQFDVVFIDGFHTYHQVKKDAINSAKCLNENGVLLFHDLLPSNWKAAVPNDMRQVSSAWNGDVFRFAFELIHNGIKFLILNIDEGVMLINDEESIIKLSKLSLSPVDEFSKLTFDYYIKYYSLLPIIEFEEFVSLMEENDETKNA